MIYVYAYSLAHLLLNVRRIPAMIDHKDDEQISRNDAQRQDEYEQRLHSIERTDVRDQHRLRVARVTAAGVAYCWCQQRARL